MARAHWVGGTPPTGSTWSWSCSPPPFFLTGMLGMAPKTAADPGRRPRPLVVDDDVYWRKGWYENPNDPRWLVQDRLVPYNYSMNMAKPGAWGGTIVLLAGGGDPPGGAVRPLPLGGFWRLLGVHHLGAGGGVCLSLRHGGGPQDIQSVTLLEALPEDDYVRTNGLTTAAASSATSAAGRPAPVRCTSTPPPPPFWRWEKGRAPSISTARPRPDPNLVRRPAGRHRRDVSVRCVLAPDLLHLFLDALPGQRV